jgi:hypothetical protein
MIRRFVHETSDTTVYAEIQRRLQLHSSKDDKSIDFHFIVEDKKSYTVNKKRKIARKISRKTISKDQFIKKLKIVISTSHRNIF